MNAQSILVWWNLIFVVPFGLALLYLGVYTLSGWTFGESDADVEHDFDAEADVDADADVHVDVDADADADIDTDADVDADADHDIAAEHDADSDSDSDHDADDTGGGGSVGSAVWAALNFLGVGKVPISLILMVLLLTWGGIGFAANQIAMRHVAHPWMVAIYSLPIAALGSLLITSGVSRGINRFMPLNVTTAKRRHELLGATGEVLYDTDFKFGMASVRDPDSGDLYQIPCRLERESSGTIAKGEKVKLVAYSAKEGMYYVLPDRSAPTSPLPVPRERVG